MDWYIKTLRQYADFNGRSRRTEYWIFLLFTLVFGSTAMLIDNVLEIVMGGIGLGPLALLFALGMFIPGLAVGVRRLHDVGKSGWMLLIILIPVIGTIWLLVLLFSDSNIGVNEYGNNPKEIIEQRNI